MEFRHAFTVPTSRSLMRTARLAVLIACGLMFALVATRDASAQRARHRAPTVAEARRMFEQLARAAAQLLALDVQPADANGQVRAWDRRWAGFVGVLHSGPYAFACDSSAASCDVREVDTLACNAFSEIETAREVAYSRGAPDGDTPWVKLANHLAARRAVADEAIRRRRAGLSCEDLPEVWDVFRELEEARVHPAPTTVPGSVSGPSSPVDDNPYD